MKKILAAVLMLGLATAYAADEKKSEAKKSSKAKTEKKSDKNAAQKADSAVLNWMHDNKVWVDRKK